VKLPPVIMGKARRSGKQAAGAKESPASASKTPAKQGTPRPRPSFTPGRRNTPKSSKGSRKLTPREKEEKEGEEKEEETSEVEEEEVAQRGLGPGKRKLDILESSEESEAPESDTEHGGEPEEKDDTVFDSDDIQGSDEEEDKQSDTSDEESESRPVVRTGEDLPEEEEEIAPIPFKDRMRKEQPHFGRAYKIYLAVRELGGPINWMNHAYPLIRNPQEVSDEDFNKIRLETDDILKHIKVLQNVIDALAVDISKTYASDVGNPRQPKRQRVRQMIKTLKDTCHFLFRRYLEMRDLFRTEGVTDFGEATRLPSQLHPRRLEHHEASFYLAEWDKLLREQRKAEDKILADFAKREQYYIARWKNATLHLTHHTSEKEDRIVAREYFVAHARLAAEQDLQNRRLQQLQRLERQQREDALKLQKAQEAKRRKQFYGDFPSRSPSFSRRGHPRPGEWGFHEGPRFSGEPEEFEAIRQAQASTSSSSEVQHVPPPVASMQPQHSEQAPPSQGMGSAALPYYQGAQQQYQGTAASWGQPHAYSHAAPAYPGYAAPQGVYGPQHSMAPPPYRYEPPTMYSISAQDVAAENQALKLYETNIKHIKGVVPTFYGLDKDKAQQHSMEIDAKSKTKQRDWLTSLDILLWEKALLEALALYPVAHLHRNRVIPSLIAPRSAADRFCDQTRQPGGPPFALLPLERQLELLREKFAGENRTRFYHSFLNRVERGKFETLADWFSRVLWFACGLKDDIDALLHGRLPSKASYQEAKRLALEPKRLHSRALAEMLRVQALIARTNYPTDDAAQYNMLMKLAASHDSQTLEEQLAGSHDHRKSSSAAPVFSIETAFQQFLESNANAMNLAYTPATATPFPSRKPPTGGSRQEQDSKPSAQQQQEAEKGKKKKRKVGDKRKKGKNNPDKNDKKTSANPNPSDRQKGAGSNTGKNKGQRNLVNAVTNKKDSKDAEPKLVSLYPYDK
jgi:hypothetical protein